MNRLLNHLAASVLSTMLIVLTPFAQDAETPEGIKAATRGEAEGVLR